MALKHLPKARLRVLARDVGLFVLLAVCIGGWKYADNQWRYGDALRANGSAAAGLGIPAKYHWEYYELTTFRLGELIRVMAPDGPPGLLTQTPPYRSVWTTLHGLAWSDMSFFSRPDRHGSNTAMYPDRDVPLWLPASVLTLAIVPNALALLGLLVSLRRRALAPLLLLGVLSFAVYLSWVLSQLLWAVKTKYILFLLPAYLVYLLLGLQWLEKRLPTLASGAVWLTLCVLLALTHLYMLEFSLGA